MSVKTVVRRMQARVLGNPWDRLLQRAQRQQARRFLLFWNRGLGDIALGLYQVILEIHEHCPGAKISVLTRPELADAFQLLDVHEVLVDPALIRGETEGVQRAIERLQIKPSDYDVVLDQINPTLWFAQRRRQPQLHWPAELDRLSERFSEHFASRFADADINVDKKTVTLCIGAHVQSETGHFYGYQKDWPMASWQALFQEVTQRPDIRIILFGHQSDAAFDDVALNHAGIIDLRGRTSFLEMMALIKNRCDVLIAPDSGVLTMSYYLAADFPIELISLWADPRQGILKQGVASPNPRLHHVPLCGRDEQVANISVDQVLGALKPTFDSALNSTRRL